MPPATIFPFLFYLQIMKMKGKAVLERLLNLFTLWDSPHFGPIKARMEEIA